MRPITLNGLRLLRSLMGRHHRGADPLRLRLKSAPAPQEAPEDEDDEKHHHDRPLPPGVRPDRLVRVEVPLEKYHSAKLGTVDFAYSGRPRGRYGLMVMPREVVCEFTRSSPVSAPESGKSRVP